MHHTIKIFFRFFLAAIIFLITFALFLTCYTKTSEIIHAEDNFKHAETFKLQSSPKEQLVLVSNNQKPDNSIFILIANQGYITKLSCEHYLPEICTDNYNQSHVRQIQNIEIMKIGQFQYIKNLSFIHSQTQQVHTINYSSQQIQAFYESDISNLKYIVFGIALFAIAALFASLKILRNFKKFIYK